MRVACLIVSLLPMVAAGPPLPQVTVGLNVGNENPGSLGGLEPRVKWATSGSVQGVDVEGGVDVIVSEVDEVPSTFLWGKLKKVFPGKGDVSIRGDVDGIERDSVDLDVRANGFGTALQVSGTADLKSNSVAVSKVQLTKSFDVLDGSLTVNPKYDLGKSAPDATVGYAMDNTSVQIDAGKKKLTIAHTFDNNDKVVPSVSASGDFSLSYTKDLEGGRLTTTWAPDDSVQLQWSDGEWATTFKAPLEGLYKTSGGIKVNMKRTVGIL